MENIKIISPPPSPPPSVSMTFTDQYFITSLCVMNDLYNTASLLKETEEPNYSVSAIFFDKFPLLFHLNSCISSPSLTTDILEKLKTHEFILNEIVKEDYYLRPPEPLNIDNLLSLASSTLGYSYEKTWKMANKLIRSGLIANAEYKTHTYVSDNNIVHQTVQYIRSTYGNEYVKETEESRLHTGGEGEWRGTIFPTTVARVPAPEDEPLYTLIWGTTIQSCMKPAYFHRYNLSISTPVLNMSFVHSLNIPIFKGWSKLSSLTSVLSKDPPPTKNIKYSNVDTTPHSALLYIQSLNRNSPVYCKRIRAEVCVSRAISYTETEVVTKLKELGIGIGEIRKAGFFQTHRKLGFVKDIGGGKEYQGYVLSFERDREIEFFKETRMNEEAGNKIVLNTIGVACAKHFYNTYQYLLNSKEYIENITKEKATSGISIELNNYINEIIEKHLASLSCIGDDSGGRLIGEYMGTELKVKRNENGEDGYYLEWGKEPHFQRKSLESLQIPSIECLDENHAIEFIEKEMRGLENSADHKRIFRVLDPYTSIRHGKFGTYIYHKTEKMKKTKFISLKKCPFNYMTAQTGEVMEWVYQNMG